MKVFGCMVKKSKPPVEMQERQPPDFQKQI